MMENAMEPMSVDTVMARVTVVTMTTEMAAARTEVRIILVEVGPNFISETRRITRSTAMYSANRSQQVAVAIKVIIKMIHPA